jgi:two-component system chemotaxis sensor kinase CheA
MGDGGIALILDVVGISSILNIKKEDIEEIETVKMPAKEKVIEEEEFFLIFQVSDYQEYFAIPLALVARLDKIRADQIEHIAGKEVVQYRGYSMPLIRLDQFMPINPLPECDEYNITVFNMEGRDIAFFASKIVDSVHAHFDLDESLYQFEGILGSAIVRGHTTLFVDVYRIIELYNPDWFKKYRPMNSYNILLAEDSIFYRNLIRSYLSSFGYEVTTAKNGKDAWEKLQKYDFDLLVTDIVMPDIDGLELSARIRQDKRLGHMPIIAISSFNNEEDIKKAQDAGIDEYISKLKLEILASIIEKRMSKQLKKVA